MTAVIQVEAGQWVERARALAPIIEQWRDDAERDLRLPAPIVGDAPDSSKE